MEKKLFIKNYRIKKLFGSYNIDIKFKYNVNIFVGENGLGKTTILNILNYVLQGDSESLATIDFQEITIVLGNNEVITIKHEELIKDEFEDYRLKNNYYYRNISYSNYISYEKRFYIDLLKMNQSELKPIQDGDFNEFTNYINRNYKYDFSPMMVEKMYEIFMNNKSLRKKIENSWEYRIYRYMEDWGQIIYLPTYRRIEEDFTNLIDSKDESEYYRKKYKKHNLKYLQFGMDDVQKLIMSTCNELRNNTNEAFKGMTSNILTQYINIFKNDNTITTFAKNKKISLEKLDIVFSRLTDKIDPDIKFQLFSLINNPEISGKDSKYIFAILSELIDIYEKNKAIDDSLENFKDVCNRYLVSNIIEYDKFKIECSIKQKDNRKNINLKSLSSGEKQIISLFSKLYLSKNLSNIILFDEPELSLSILWQRKLLPDIMNSNRCNFIIAITHSPFIFDNEYSKYAVDIQNYIKINNE